MEKDCKVSFLGMEVIQQTFVINMVSKTYQCMPGYEFSFFSSFKIQANCGFCFLFIEYSSPANLGRIFMSLIKAKKILENNQNRSSFYEPFFCKALEKCRNKDKGDNHSKKNLNKRRNLNKYTNPI